MTRKSVQVGRAKVALRLSRAHWAPSCRATLGLVPFALALTVLLASILFSGLIVVIAWDRVGAINVFGGLFLRGRDVGDLRVLRLGVCGDELGFT